MPPVVKIFHKKRKYESCTNKRVTGVEGCNYSAAENMVQNNISFNSCNEDNNLYWQMFPASSIVKHYCQGRWKVKYVIQFCISLYIYQGTWRMIFKASLLRSILIKQHIAKSRHGMMAVPLTSARNTRKNLLHILWIPVYWKMHHWWYVGPLSQVYEKSSFKP